MLLDGRIALITGAGSGMGRAATLRFCSEGALVVAVDVDRDAVDETVSMAVAMGGHAGAEVADATDLASLETLFASIESEFGKLDVLYLHVGGTVACENTELTEADFDDSIRLNLKSSVLGAKVALPLLARSGSASVIFTASMAGLGPVPDLLLYSAVKAAVVHFMKSLAVAVGPMGIRANAIAPGGVATPMLRRWLNAEDAEAEAERIRAAGARLPLGRLAEPEDIADIALFLASDLARYVTGVVIPANGGGSVADA